ncbi:MAG: serine--tRNA ligase [Candidatus Methylomirabilia bacterium]
MLDVRLIRARPDEVARALKGRGGDDLVDRLLSLDAVRRQQVTAVEAKKALRNKVTEEIARAKRRGEHPTEKIARMRQLGDEIKEEDAKVSETDREIESLLLQLPNVPHSSVPVGGEEENQEVRRWGAPRQFAFDPKLHWEIGERLGILDFERAAKLAKSRFSVLWGAGARLERALAQFMLDLHTREHGYREVWVPHMVNPETMWGTAQLPKFEDQLFKTLEPEGERALYLIPTAEVPVTCLHGGEILKEQELPKRYVAFTPCYRREAGAAGQDTRGMIRQHQFDKVELVKVTTPASSYAELEGMVRNAEEVLRRLELPHRVVLLAAGDTGFAAAKTYDLEVWLPGQGRYREISSCSNCEAFQSRRAEIRYRPATGGKADYCHTLNGSGVAVGRALVAVLENYQEADGSVVIPAALRPYMDGLERISA